MSEHQKDAVGAARDMTTALRDLSDRLEATRRLTWRTTAAVTIDIILSVLLVVVYAQARHNSATVTQLRASAVAACQTGNRTRAQEIALWDHIATLSITSKTPEKQRTADERLLTYIRRVFAPNDCTDLYRQP